MKETTGEKIFDSIFYEGFFILSIINTVSLWNQKKELITYFIFYVFNSMLNEFLKRIIREPRPKGFEKNIELTAIPYGGIHHYGMPSGHSQSCFFSLVFLWLVTRSYILFIIEFIICLLTVFQRWKNKKHTIEQLGLGAIVGSLFAYIAYYITNHYEVVIPYN
jgi:membrane-associated phospholipid phosphatase